MAYLVDPGLPLALSLDNFIVGSSNAKACAICLEALERTKPFNPIVLTGPNGCGKTHLLVALFRKSLLEYSYLRSLYLDAASLTRLLSDSREGELPQLDLLFLDDLQSLPPDLEGPFLSFFDRSFHSGAQIFIALDREPAKLSLKSGVLSRLSQALTIKLDYPDEETRRLFMEREFFKFFGERLDNAHLTSLLKATQAKSMREILGLLQNEPTLVETAAAKTSPASLDKDSKTFGFVFAPSLEISTTPKDFVLSQLLGAIKNHRLPLNLSWAGPFLYSKIEDITSLAGLWPLFGNKPNFCLILMKPTETANEEEKFTESLTTSLKNLGTTPLVIAYREREQNHVYLSAAMELLFHCSRDLSPT